VFNPKHSLFALTALSLALATGCTKKEESHPTTTGQEAQTTATTAPAAPQAPADASKVSAELSIGSDGDAIAFDKNALNCKAGQTVRLTLKNNSKSSAMQHNWVLIQPGKVEEVEQASIQAGAEKGWIATGHAAIIANTKLTNPGETDSVVFVCPAQAGEYPFVCTFPGHVQAMKGVLTVK
jgi:azurin